MPSPWLKWGLLLLVLLPCLPGLTFLLAGLALDPHWHARDPSVAGLTIYATAMARARSLYLAGALTLMVGTFGMAAVLWKIARPGRSYAEEAEEEAAREAAEATDSPAAS